MKDDLKECILKLHKDNDWLEILNLLQKCSSKERKKFLWPVPDVADICWLENILKEHNIRSLVSVGCGSGLLEWIISQKIGCKVIGVEVDRKWWQSNYAPPRFFRDVIFADENDGKIPPVEDHALLFCYFNNGRAFRDYMLSTTSSVALVIGPNEARDRFTNPMPFDEKFRELGWRLSKFRELRKSDDCVSVFVRSNPGN